MKKYVCLLALLFVSSEVIGQSAPVHSFYSGFALLRDCGSYVAARNKQANQAEIEAATICAGYVMGISDAHDMFSATNMSPTWCAPDNVTVGQLVNPVHKYIISTPEKMHLPASGIIVSALMQTYPCP